ncbi:MAP kinase-activating death domain protein-like [Watersipora subatra]|uniref:MAP kinase-activating death domain protein-like n=1 Tax=Watersipora subatra TaxID=2589382 RepID=UPI00355C96F6
MGEAQKHFCPRLVDYIAIIGSCNPSVDSETPQQPDILRRYPAQDHDDFILPRDTAYFCQPEGCTTIGAKQMSLRDRRSFVFALTDKDSGKRRYGTCLNFYRPFKKKYKSKQLHEQNSVESTSSNEGVSRSHNSLRVKALRSHTLTSLCILSHHALFDTFRECLNVLARLIDVCNLAASKKKVGGRRVDNLVWKYLVKKLCESADTAVLHWVKQLETWVYTLLSCPVPVPGKCFLELHIVPETVGQPHILALPDETRFSLVDFPLHLPLELLGVEKCIQVLECIMLEQKVLLMSKDYNALTMSVLALVAMIYPLEYMFPVIPLLPASLDNSEQLLYAPTPYIIGIPTSFGQTRKTCLPNDVWLFDLDSDSVRAPPGPGGQLPPLPEPDGSMLRTHFKQALASLTSVTHPLKSLNEMTSQQTNPLKAKQSQRQGHSFNPFIYGNDIDCVDVATRVAMVRFFASPNILGNIQEHTRILRLYPRPVVGFQLSSFIKSRAARSLFICRLASTQAVEFYTEWSLSPTNVAFMRVQTGIFDPKQIGDKPRWYSQQQQKIEYRVSTNIDQTIFQLSEKSTDVPTDESGDSDEEHHFPPSPDSDIEQSGYSDSIKQSVAISVGDVYRPPTELHKVDTLTAPTSSSDYDSSDGYNSSSSEDGRSGKVVSYNGDEISEPSVMENGETVKAKPVPKQAPRRPPPIKHLNSKSNADSTETQRDLLSTLSADIGGVAQTATSRLTEFLGVQQENIPKSRIPRTNSQHQQLNERFNEGQGSQKRPVIHPQAPTPSLATPCTASPVLHAHYSDKLKDRLQQDSRNVVHGENQVFLKEAVANVLDGNGIGWLKTGRIKRLMEDENYRNFVMSRLNTQLDVKLSGEEQSIGEVQVTRTVYKGIVSMLNMIVHGLEHTYKTNGSGGVASALMVLEVAATHYYVRDNKSNNSSRANSPFGSRESLVTLSKDGHTTPTKQLQQKQLEQYTSNIQSVAAVEGPTPSAQSTISSNNENTCEPFTSNPPSDDRPDTSPDSVNDSAADITDQKYSDTSRKDSIRSPISHESLRKISSASSERSSPTNSEAINNYSLSVAQGETENKLAVSPSPPGGGDAKLTGNTPSSTSSEHQAAKVYVYEGLLGKARSHLWDQMQFWEDVFLDGVAQERDIIGLDQEPAALMDRYHLLGEYEKKRLEFEEDRLLSTMLYNLTSLMVMMNCLKSEVKKKNRRLLGKSHIGLLCSQTVNSLLDNIEKLETSDVSIKPVPSRTQQKQSFSVHWGSDNTGDMFFMEVCEEAILLRSVNGVIVERWWYERLVNMAYCPKTKLLCLWRKGDGHATVLNKFYTKKCRDLYNAIKETMERVVSRNDTNMPVNSNASSSIVSGRFEVEDPESNKPGVLQVCMDGISLFLDKTKFFVHISHIKKCFTMDGGFFVWQELDAKTGAIRQRKVRSAEANEICYAVLCIFSYMAAGTDHNSNSKELTTAEK